jgi:inorganic pyrophosphatase/exopolyphosphatase
MGNTSGDMDSIVGALGLAYFYTLKHGEQWTPVVNCKKDEFHYNAEIFLHIVTNCGIPIDDILFWDELINLKKSYKQIALIDHNMIDGGNMKDLGDDAGSKVTHIIDHHFDNKAYPESQLQESVIKFIGSACSIAVLQMKAHAEVFSPDHWEPDTRNFAYFYAAAIALDTYNFKEALRGTKWQEDDELAWNWLKQFYNFNDSYFQELCDAKFD